MERLRQRLSAEDYFLRSFSRRDSKNALARLDNEPPAFLRKMLVTSQRFYPGTSEYNKVARVAALPRPEESGQAQNPV